MILKPMQAKAIYNARCERNNVSISDGIRISFVGVSTVDHCAEQITVEEPDRDVIRVTVGGGLLSAEREYHAGQAAFAAAYNLN